MGYNQLKAIKKCNLKEKLRFSNIESDNVFKMLNILDQSKAPAIDHLSRIFLKDGALLLATSTTQLSNLSISSGRFHRACKTAKFKGTLIQIWKSANIFVFIWKQYVEDFTLKHFLLFEICAHEICEKFVYKHSETIEYLKN